MKKSTIIITVIAIVAVIAVVVYFMIGKGDTNTNNDAQNTKLATINSQEDLSKLIDQIYENANMDAAGLQTTEVDVQDVTSIKSYTGLDDVDKFEYVVVSEPLINARAYSLVVAKVKDGENANEIAKQMSENVDTRKWICVAAEKLYATSSGDVVFLIMTEEETAKNVYESFKNIAGTIGKEYEKTQQEEELPPDMLESGVFEVPEN